MRCTLLFEPALFAHTFLFIRFFRKSFVDIASFILLPFNFSILQILSPQPPLSTHARLGSYCLHVPSCALNAVLATRHTTGNTQPSECRRPRAEITPRAMWRDRRTVRSACRVPPMLRSWSGRPPHASCRRASDQLLVPEVGFRKVAGDRISRKKKEVWP